MKNILLILLLLYPILRSSAQNWQYLEQTPPTTSSEVFAPQKVSTQHNERDFAISPDGKEIYYSLVSSQNLSLIMVRKYINNKWQLPQIASFSGGFHDIEPAFSVDGKQLFFASNRLSNAGGLKDFDIWVVSRKADGNWSEAESLGSGINTSANEYFPSLTKNGTLYWTANYASGNGGEDIWFSRFENGAYQKPEVMPTSVCGRTNEFNAFIDPNEKFIIFGSEGRTDAVGSGDLYISYNNNGTWATARNMGNKVNSSRLDYCPYVSNDGKYFFFTSEKSIQNENTGNPLKINDFLKMLNSSGNGKGDIYWIEASAVITK